METTYSRFKKIFKKGEQICIFGVNWQTHGYISAIEEDGITLVQLNNVKGIKYNWNCFEIIFHAGFKVYKSNLTEVANIFEFKISTHLPNIFELKNLPKEVQTVKINEIRIDKNCLYFSTDIPFLKHEVLPDWLTYNEYCEGYFKDKSLKYKCDPNVYLNFKIGRYGYIRNFSKGKIRGYMGNWNINDGFKAFISEQKDVMLFPPQIEDNLKYIISPLHANQKYNDISHPKLEIKRPEIWHEAGKKYKYGNWERYERYPLTIGNIQSLRTTKWETATGDPYIFEGIPIGYKLWKNENGYILANQHADIYI